MKYYSEDVPGSAVLDAHQECHDISTRPGAGLVVPAMTSAFLEAVGVERAGIASGVLQASRQIGGVVGVALFGSLVAQAGLVRGMHQGQAVAAVAMLIGCTVTLIFVSQPMHGARSEKG